MTDLVPDEASGSEAIAAEQEQPWLRLDKRMLLVHPVNEAVKFLPVLLASFFIGAQSGNHMWSLVALALIVLFALLRWFTTFYRIGAVHIELRTGLFQKKLLSIPRTRIRSVDSEASLLHRVLGLSVVRIGTGTQAGSGDEKFLLNALDASLVPGLRAALLTKPAPQEADSLDKAQPPVAATEIAHFSPNWVKYAPFSSTGVVAILAAVGIAFQYGLGQRIADSSVVSNSVDAGARFGIVLVVIVGLLLLLLLASVFACVRYLLTYGGLEVIDDGRVLHVNHGLLKTRQTSLDRARLRGATLKEPLLLRLAGGAKLDGIMTGVSAEKQESSLVLPQAPAAHVRRVLAHLLGDATQGTVALTPHGPSAMRRRFTRALLPIVAVVVGLLVAKVVGWDVPWFVWIVVVAAFVAALGLAWDRYRGLGHAILPGWLVTQSGSLDRDRDCLESAGIIGWTVRQSFFQRRAGVATIVAATAAGKRHYDVLDLPIDDAWALVDAVTPGAGDIWVRTDR
ncbi:PH domain-containing protein [Antrihabitans spumae]|jgi:putative membrane protein|uniref:PH domain-containing protein n=1 Tax=Antrihabitans spumae TaxID=3373370 RepID=A0ABW7JVT7_9NOCA